MKENVFSKKMYYNVLQNGFDLIIDYRNCFRDEMCDPLKEDSENYFDFNHFSNDMLDDCLALLRQLNDLYKHDRCIDYEMALKISKWYEAVDELIEDFRTYLLVECQVLYWKRIQAYINLKKEERGK